MTIRKVSLVSDQVYHIFTKSIAGFKVFNNKEEFLRIVKTVCYYLSGTANVKFSRFIKKESNINIDVAKEKYVEIIAYCLMPTHLHFILKQLKENGISIFMRNILNSYTKYFNIKHNRKGPLWEGRFKNKLIENDEYLLHLTRYIHLNPVTAGLVDMPENWALSSYNEYLLKIENRICNYEGLLNINPISYKEFVDDQISYQRELTKIKEIIIE